MITDPIADMMTRIRNAQMARHATVRVPASKMNEAFLKVLSAEGFIEGIERRKDAEEKFDEFEVTLKYVNGGLPLLRSLRRVSKPSRRVYRQTDGIPKVSSGLGIAVLSTSQGVMSDREARKRGIGGEVLALVS